MARIGVQQTTTTVPTSVQYGDIIIRKNGNLGVVDETGKIIEYVPVTGGASSIVTNNLTASRALVSDASGKVAVSAVTATELGYLDGVTSAVQTQLNGKLPLSGGTMGGNIASLSIYPTVSLGHNVGLPSNIYNNGYIRNIHTFVIDGVAQMKGQSSTGWIYLNSAQVHCVSFSSNSTYVPIYASAFTTQSSLKYKNVTGDMPIEEAKKILDVELKEFTYKTSQDRTPNFGVIAEQLDEIGLTFPVTYNEGNPDGVDYSKFVPYLIGLGKLHEKEINELKEKADKLDRLTTLLVEKGVLAQEEIDNLNG